MECAACVARLDRALEKLPGVQRAAVNYTAASALITYDERVTDLAAIAARVKRAGFRVPVEEQDLLPAEADAETAAAAADALRAVFGVKSVAVQADGTLTAYLWPIGVDGRDLAAACAVAGCAVTPGELRGGDADQELEKRMDLLKTLVTSACCTAPLMLEMHPKLQFLAGTALQFGPGRYFYKSAWRGLRNRTFGMDFLVSLSSTLIYLYSAYVTFTPRRSYKLYFASDGVLRGHVCRAAGRPDRGARPGAHPSRRARTGRRHGRQRSVRGRRVHAHRREHAGGQSARRQGHRRQPQPLRLGHRLGRGAGQGVRARADHPDRAPGPVRKSTRAALCRQGRALVRAGRHRRGGADVPHLVPAHCAAQP